MKVLLSIKPEFVNEMVLGNKKFEYRKSIFKRADVTDVVVYATKPYGKVVGEFKIDRIIDDNPSNIWQRTKKFSGTTQNFFYDYFSNRKRGFAIAFSEFKSYEKPLELGAFNLKCAPQSFCYIEG
ncbi:hypothetical protein [Paucilactobacillus nenjiangensis]|jgi:predicted transcriptional regulator|uniref:ASCH domain-containing protein n=1 Tax=Paucilactobacillus nenjiangensis TaxID=1296540 RepID=A0A5P1X7B5_9LACO|nr:hypothetical protein [Paucilactobacillus nenjiangensis]QER68148.1 hypothetical protein F0161_10060 [Paucilactobacillus nenjiangensis]